MTDGGAERGGGGAGRGDGGVGLRPGEDIRPAAGPADALALARALYALPPHTRARALNSYDDKNFHLQVPKDGLVNDEWSHGYLLKILNSYDSRNPNIVEAQNELMLHLGRKGVKCTQPIKNIYGKYYSIERIKKPEEGDGGKLHIVRLLTFQPGEILYKIPCTPKLFYEVGQYIANLNILMQDFHHIAYESHKTNWMLEAVPQLKEFIFAIEDNFKHSLAIEVIDSFEKDIMPHIPFLERGLLHGDFNEQNILVQKSDRGEWHIHGVIDFGDSHISCHVFELSITICYMMLQSKLLDPFDAPGHVIAGYITKRSIPDTEFHLLKKCICARLCQSLVMGAYSYKQDPTNKYLLTTAQTGWELLHKLWNSSEEQLNGRWKAIIQSYT